MLVLPLLWSSCRSVDRHPDRDALLEQSIATLARRIDYARADATLIAVVSIDCQYCVDTMAMYRQFVRDTEDVASQIQLAIVGNQREETLRAFALEHGLRPAAVVSAPRDGVRFESVPTSILVDRTGDIRSRWVGQQTNAVESMFSRTAHQLAASAQDLSRWTRPRP
jgi:hypothetical protein